MVASIFYFIYAVGFVVFLAAAIVILATRLKNQSDEKIKNNKTNGGSIDLSSYTKYAKRIPPKLIGWWIIFVLIIIRVVHKDPASLVAIIIALTLIMYFFYWLIIGPTGRGIRDSQAFWLAFFAFCIVVFFVLFTSGLEWVTEYKFREFFSHL